MGYEAVDRITDEPTSWSEWSYLAGGVPTAQTETTNIAGVDMGTMGPSTNSDAKGLTVELDPDFDDSAYNVRIWMANNPEWTDHTWMGEFGAAAAFPLVTADAALTNGVAIPCSPMEAITTRWLGAGMYDSTEKRIREMLIQLQVGAAGKIFDSNLKIDQIPRLVVEFQRMDPTLSGLETGMLAPELSKGHLFTFSDVNLFQISPTGCWSKIAAIREDTFDLSSMIETINWEKGKPKVVFHQAGSSVTAEAKFSVDEVSPAFKALALDTKPVENTKDQTMDVSLNGKKKPTRTSKFAIQWVTEGGFQCTWYVDKAKIVPSGSMTPGSSDAFAGEEFTITPLASGCLSEVVKLKWSNVPLQAACWLPLGYNVTA